MNQQSYQLHDPIHLRLFLLLLLVFREVPKIRKFLIYLYLRILLLIKRKNYRLHRLCIRTCTCSITIFLNLIFSQLMQSLFFIFLYLFQISLPSYFPLCLYSPIFFDDLNLCDYQLFIIFINSLKFLQSNLAQPKFLG